jgi:hypothetical protein
VESERVNHLAMHTSPSGSDIRAAEPVIDKTRSLVQAIEARNAGIERSLALRMPSLIIPKNINGGYSSEKHKRFDVFSQ